MPSRDRGSGLQRLDGRSRWGHGLVPSASWLGPAGGFVDLPRVDDFYFDAVSKVALPSWSAGRVVLLGDAAASVSLFGDGSSLAIAGARTLAATLAEGEHVTAFRRYEAEHRRRTDARGRGAGLVAAMLIPKTRAGILARNTAARLLPTSPGGQ